MGTSFGGNTNEWVRRARRPRSCQVQIYVRAGKSLTRVEPSTTKTLQDTQITLPLRKQLICQIPTATSKMSDSIIPIQDETQLAEDLKVIATYVSALSFLGAPAWSYTEGLSVIAIHTNYPIVIFLVILPN